MFRFFTKIIVVLCKRRFINTTHKTSTSFPYWIKDSMNKAVTVSPNWSSKPVAELRIESSEEFWHLWVEARVYTEQLPV